MKLSYCLVIASAILGSTTVNSQTARSTFLFNQCECVARDVAPDQVDNLFSSAVIVGAQDNFECVQEDASGFPAESGILVNQQGSAARFESTAEQGLFTDGSSNRLLTYTFGEIEVNSENEIGEIQLSRFGFGVNAATLVSSTSFRFNPGNNFATLEFSAALEDNSLVESVRNVNAGSNQFTAKFCSGESLNDATVDVFACLDVGDGTGFSCDRAQDVNSLNLIAVSSQVNTRMLEYNSADGEPYVIKSIEFGNGLGFGEGGVSDIEAACNGLAALDRSVDTIPTINNLTFSVVEDEQVTMNVGSRLEGGTITGNDLDFSINVGDLSGQLIPSDITNGVSSFQYTPDQDVNGDQIFTFTYAAAAGQSIVCSTSANFTLTIDPFNDAPVAVNSEHEVEATVELRLIDELVANDVDFANDFVLANGFLNDGTFNVITLPAGTVTDCGDPATELDTSSSLNINNGVTSICYTPAATVVDDVTETLTFSVSDGELTSVANGTITFNGNNPFVITSRLFGPFSEEGVETVNTGLLGEDRDGGNDVSFQVRITALPVGFGDLTTDAGGQDLVAVDQEFDDNTNLFFHAADGIFNADNGLTFINGRSIGVCPAGQQVLLDLDTAQQQFTNYCPISFEYEIFAELDGNFVTETGGQGFFLINAVDDGQASFQGAPDVQNVEVDGNGDGIASLPSFTIFSDDGNDVFEVDLLIIGTNGVSFSGFSSAITRRDGELNGEEEEDCGIQPCDQVVLTARPSVLEQALNALNVQVPTGIDNQLFTIGLAVVAAPEGAIDVGSTDPQTTIQFNVDNTPPSFFESTGNIFIVAGTGVAVIVIISMFFIYRTTRARAIGETNILNLAAANVDKELRDKKKREKRERRERRRNEESNRKDDELERAPAKQENDDEIFDWEKHIDEKTKETYFFNPKTGESRWDPPTVKNTI